MSLPPWLQDFQPRGCFLSYTTNWKGDRFFWRSWLSPCLGLKGGMAEGSPAKSKFQPKEGIPIFTHWFPEEIFPEEIQSHEIEVAPSPSPAWMQKSNSTLANLPIHLPIQPTAMNQTAVIALDSPDLFLNAHI